MNKFSLLLMSLVIFGNVLASEIDVKASSNQVSHLPVNGLSVPKADAIVENSNATVPKADAKVENPVVAKGASEKNSAKVNVAVPAPTLKKGDKESLPASKVDAIKAFFAHGLIKVQGGVSFAKYYLLGDFLTKYLVDKKYITDANKVLLTSYVTPKLLVNYVAGVVLFNVVYFGYKALASSNQEDQDDFLLEGEDFD